LRGAEFWDAHLERTDFWGANLKGVRFDRADLIEADLTGADLSDAELRLATGLTREQVASALNQGKGALLAPGLL